MIRAAKGTTLGTNRFSATELARLTANGTSLIEKILADHLFSIGSGRPSDAEARSWAASLPVLARDLNDAGLGGVEVLAEHRLPLSSKRADAVLAGTHPKTGRPSYVVVELKQWSSATRWEDSDTLVDVQGARYRPVLHPSLQVAGYADYMRDFVRIFADGRDTITPAAYLHNATEGSIEALRDSRSAREARLFTGQRRGDFHDFLRTHLSPESGVDAADALLSSAVAPSKQLLAVAADEIRDREQFVLLDEQRVAFELVLAAVRRAHAADQKSVVIVTGGPGSGKSVIALSLLGELAREGRTVLHATGSRSFTTTLRQVVGKGSASSKRLFTYFNNFMDAEKNSLDVLVMDEAHRIRASSVQRFTPKAVRDLARPQAEELLDVARVPVFLLDQFQVVRPGEMGSVEQIRSHAAARNLPVVQVDLNAQYRSGGSDAYLDWVVRLLGLRGDGPVEWRDEPGFTVTVADSPAEMESTLAEHQRRGLTARMTAGYCWPWSNPASDGTLARDVVIGDWRRPWNLRGDRAVGEAPPAALWATAPGGFGQVGCVYTAQGFEYAWNGVIIGPDLVWRKDRWVPIRDANRDPDFRSRSKVDDATFDRLIRHVYKVLLTRGMVGTVLYSVDEETREMLRNATP